MIGRIKEMLEDVVGQAVEISANDITEAELRNRLDVLLEKYAHEIQAALFKGDEKGLLTPEDRSRVIKEWKKQTPRCKDPTYKLLDVMMCEAQRSLTEQKIPEVVKAERERIVNELIKCHHSCDAIQTGNEFEAWLLTEIQTGKLTIDGWQALRGERNGIKDDIAKWLCKEDFYGRDCWDAESEKNKNIYRKQAEKLGQLIASSLPGMSKEEIRVIAEKSDSKYEWHEDSYRAVVQAYKKIIVKELEG